MKPFFIAFALFLMASCSATDRTYHSMKVVKPRYHHTWYKDSKWHNKIQVGRIRVRLFEKQGVKSVKMKG